MEIDDIMTAIAALDPYERSQFESQYAAYKEGNQRELPRHTQYVADAVSEICHIRLSPAKWRKLSIDARSADLYAWLGDQITGLTETQVKGLVRICLRSIASNYLVDDPAVLLDGIKRVGPAMNQSFPGYRDSGLLYRLVQRADAA